MSTELTTRASRRAILAAAAGGAAAIAASSLARPFPAAAAAANMQTETDNATVAPTGVSNATGDSGALFGTGTTGYGLKGVSSDDSDPTNHLDNVGVIGAVGDTSFIDAEPKGNTGVFGYAPENLDWFGTGVWGHSNDYGVFGTGGVGVGGAGGIGVQATSEGDPSTSLALQVLGRAEFSRSGRTYVSAGQSKRAVALPGCTSSSLVFAVLSSNRSGRYVRAVVPTTNAFTIYLNTTVSSKSWVVWIAFTNPAGHLG